MNLANADTEFFVGDLVFSQQASGQPLWLRHKKTLLGYLHYSGAGRLALVSLSTIRSQKSSASLAICPSFFDI